MRDLARIDRSTNELAIELAAQVSLLVPQVVNNRDKVKVFYFASVSISVALQCDCPNQALPTVQLHSFHRWREYKRVPILRDIS